MSCLDFKVVQFQLSVFAPGLIFRTTKVLASLLSGDKNTVEWEPVILPVPDEAPEEIPRIVLTANASSLKIEVLKTRVNFYLNIKESDSSDDAVNNFKLLSISLIEKYKEATKARIGRIAVVYNKFAVQEEPALYLAQHFCKEPLLTTDGPFNRPENFEIHAHKRYPLGDFNINSWVRCKNAFLINKQERKQGVSVVQDLNTLAEEIDVKEYSISDIEKYLDLVEGAHKEIINKYFLVRR